MSKLYIVMYHYVRDLSNSRYPSIKGLDYHLFEQQIQYFAKNFNVVTMEEVLDFFLRGGGETEKPGSVTGKINVINF